jgi:hypothetical protein
MFAVSDRLSGEAVTPNSTGMTPMARLAPFFYAHLDAQ